MARLAVIALLSLALAGCSPPAVTSTVKVSSPALPTQQVVPGWKAVLSPGSQPGNVLVEYRNESPDEIVVSEQVLLTNCLALEVFDSTGRPKGTVPPSVPWVSDPGVRIPPGGVYRRGYDLHMFSPQLPPGHYRVRVQVPGCACEPMEYVVKAETK